MLFKEKGLSFIQFQGLSIGDRIQYKIQSDNRPIGSYAKVIRNPQVSVFICFVEPYIYGDISFDVGDIIVADRLEISFVDSPTKKKCNVCGAYEKIETVEVFGIIHEKELGCSACIGVTYFPY
jgi:hypothetical protein